MYHGMTVWTYWTEIYPGVNDAFTANFRQRNQVMHVDESFAVAPIPVLKIHVANRTDSSENPNTFVPCPRIPLEYVEFKGPVSTFWKECPR